MKGTPAIYLGRIVEKNNFRVFVYGSNGEQKLINSWDEFEASMQSGVWFATVEDAIAIKAIAVDAEDAELDVKTKPKPKPRAKPKPKPELVEEVDDSDDVLPDDGSVFEVTDDFLPTESE